MFAYCFHGLAEHEKREQKFLKALCDVSFIESLHLAIEEPLFYCTESSAQVKADCLQGGKLKNFVRFMLFSLLQETKLDPNNLVEAANRIQARLLYGQLPRCESCSGHDLHSQMRALLHDTDWELATVGQFWKEFDEKYCTMIRECVRHDHRQRAMLTQTVAPESQLSARGVDLDKDINKESAPYLASIDFRRRVYDFALSVWLALQGRMIPAPPLFEQSICCTTLRIRIVAQQPPNDTLQNLIWMRICEALGQVLASSEGQQSCTFSGDVVEIQVFRT